MRYFIYFVIAVVAAAIVAGFFIVPSPAQERMRQLDNQRVNDLQNIQSEVLNYWINKAILPKALADLRDDLRGISVPVDPASGAPYGYAVKSPLTFSICATFDLSSDITDTSGAGRLVPKSAPIAPPGVYGNELSQNWQHGAGLTCFDRVIDKDFYSKSAMPR